MPNSENEFGEVQKKTYSEVLDRLGFFCHVCDREVRNASGLVAFTSKESVKGLNVCHDCLPEDFE